LENIEETLKTLTNYKNPTNIIKVIDYGTHFVSKNHKILYYIMEQFKGDSLKKISITKKQEIQNYLTISECVLNAVQELNNKVGLIHLDIKPDNILINRDTGECKLIDFDLAKNIKSPLKLDADFYLAPLNLLIDDQAYENSSKIDEYKTGLALTTLLLGKQAKKLFKTDTLQDMINPYLSKKFNLEKVSGSLNYSLKDMITKHLKSLITNGTKGSRKGEIFAENLVQFFYDFLMNLINHDPKKRDFNTAFILLKSKELEISELIKKEYSPGKPYDIKK
jgi:serine/threonine protein kinase